MIRYISASVLLSVLLLTVSCSLFNKEKAQAHAHDDFTIPYTAYGNGVEVFVDAQPLAINHTSQLVVHFTDLKTFKPCDIKEVVAELIVDGSGLRQSAVNANETGIFKFSFKPDKSGMGSLVFKFTHNGEAKAIRIDNVDVYPDAHEAVHLAEAKFPTSASAISFTKEQSWKVEFATSLPSNEPFGSVIKSAASVQASPADQVLVSAKTSGFVSFSHGVISAGQDLIKGQQVFTVSSDGITANNAQVLLEKAKVEMNLAKNEYGRHKQLADKQIVSNKELMERKARYETAQTEYHNIRKAVNENGEHVVAPFSAYVNEVFVENGQYVEAGEAIYSLVRNQRMVLTAMISQSNIRDLQNIVDVNIEVGESILNLKDLNGKVLSVGKTLSRNNYLLPVTIEVDFDTMLMSGGFTNVYIKTAGKKSLVIPETALAEEQGNFFVYVQLTPELFEKRQVHLGASDGVNRALKSGLNANERIVTKGAILVKLAAVSNSIDPHAGHVH
ncbi:efflux RND transporter periplasmic adaptor subunit [Carboxylicivirga sp. N1Y90]|uniref:efflux RND transporter periplasmic adaptor subunit n=1 Tax=Carboxylicivirga fragile TaxID=3417571 RepID=UPI003D33421F|nr:efflux RND transporter periplasmic adaptor subunit [Marinilabiliaceae bacterium N1Y90]